MGSYKGRGPAGGDRRPSGHIASDDCRNRTQNSEKEQREGLDRLGAFRAELDYYGANGCIGNPPQPAEFSLKLGRLSATEIWWGAT